MPFILFALFLLIPIISIIIQAFISFNAPLFIHTVQTVLPSYLYTSSLLTIFTLIITLLLAIPPAFITSKYNFSGRTLLIFLHTLPLAIPAYIMAGIYTEAFPFFESLPGLILSLSVSLAPYIFLFIKLALQRTSKTYTEVAQSLGAGAFTRFIKLHLPLLTPTIIICICFIVSQCWGDYSTAERLGIQTFTVGIYNLWFGFGNKNIALMLISLILIASIIILLLMAYAYKKNSIGNPKTAHKITSTRTTLPKIKAVIAFIICVSTALPGALIPIYYTTIWSAKKLSRAHLNTLYLDIGSSLFTSFSVTLICAVIALTLLFWINNNFHIKLLRLTGFIALINYTIPSLAFALLILMGASHQGVTSEPFKFLLGNRGAIILGCCIRFFPFILIPISDTLIRLPSNLRETSQSLQAGKLKFYTLILLPYLQPAIKVGISLVFLESLKELTMSMLLQPFSYNALPIRIFNLASLHATQDASIFVLILILLCILPIKTIAKYID